MADQQGQIGIFHFLSLFVVAASMRLFLMYSPANEWFADRIELSTPLTSWSRVQEGIVLLNNGISPYAGDIVHEAPLVVTLFYGLKDVSSQFIPLIFIVIDIVIGCLLYKVAVYNTKNLLTDQERIKSSFAKNVSPILLTEKEFDNIPFLTTAVYLLNPYSVSTCVAQSTIIFTNLGLTLALFGALKGSSPLATLGIALATYHSLYPIMLLAPVTLIVIKYDEGSQLSGMCKCGMLFTVWIAGLLGLSYSFFNSWDFIKATYGFILGVPDLTPNIGLFWYFFTEMFEHFRVFFLWVFQINAFFYCIPLTVRLREHPSFLACILCLIMAIMKSYPAFGDAALPLSLLVLWKHLFPYLRNAFLISCMLLFSTFLAPVFWYLWIYAGSANANFFFAVTLAYSTAQILLASDVLFAFLRRERDLVRGIFPKIINGEVATITLK
ncbi:phosphatidylinositol glycan anchor biosynthesis class U protein-like [Actinia tenebrosa]|uniref:Phosphatidylinositol glycan anchor biosynthesis class U protein-like n=1 Tax=Actinia tenebrosa TaxID=6105 RepID=A0A6P8I323_ACTTE|nr:phosphatidylinositol glycan anchor biosynthesis class U protein-like [Actinia tenebrosa]